MLTIILCYINAKYNHDYQGMFLVTFLLDVELIQIYYFPTMGMECLMDQDFNIDLLLTHE